MGQSALEKINFAAVDLQIQNQAQGDMLYFDGSNWVRVPVGTALQQLRVNAGVTAPEWATIAAGLDGNFGIINISRDMLAVSGDIPYTGLGFQPKAVWSIAGVGISSYASIGFAHGVTEATDMRAMYNNTDVDNWSSGGQRIVYLVGSGKSQTAGIVSFDVDGLTLSWAKGGTPLAGTLTANLFCIA